MSVRGMACPSLSLVCVSVYSCVMIIYNVTHRSENLLIMIIVSNTEVSVGF